MHPNKSIQHRQKVITNQFRGRISILDWVLPKNIHVPKNQEKIIRNQMQYSENFQELKTY